MVPLTHIKRPVNAIDQEECTIYHDIKREKLINGTIKGFRTLPEKVQERFKKNDSANYAAIDRILAIPK